MINIFFFKVIFKWLSILNILLISFYKMKILIIKNDGFGDLIIIKDLLKKINKEKKNRYSFI